MVSPPHRKEKRGPWKKLTGGSRTRMDMSVSESSTPCVVVFHLETGRASFLTGGIAPVEGAKAPIAILGDVTNSFEVLEQAVFVKVKNGLAKTVMCFGKVDPNADEFKYGMALRIKDRGSSDYSTDIIIDPKIKND